MKQNIAEWVAGIIGLVIIVGGAYLFWRHSSPPAAVAPVATSTLSDSGQAAISSNPGYTIEVIPNAPPAPEYKTPLVCAADIPTTACAGLQAQDATLVAQITKDQTNGNAWINLGTLRKINEDYKGAEAAWAYVAKLFPSNPIAFSNLGDLYMNFLHDYPKAELNYLTAIKNAPANTSFYQTLFTLYTTTSYTPSAAAAEDILKKGIAANPKAVSLQVTLARYYKSLGRSADAKAQYDAAIANAESQGQVGLAAQIQAEAGQ